MLCKLMSYLILSCPNLQCIILKCEKKVTCDILSNFHDLEYGNKIIIEVLIRMVLQDIS